MATVAQTIAKMEGLIGTLTDTEGSPDQGVAAWLEGAKSIMRQKDIREKEDWDFIGSSADLDESEDTIEASAGTLYGALGMVFNAGQDYTFATYNHGTPTPAAADWNDGGNMSAAWVVRNSDAAITTYGGVLFPGGIAHDTYITIGAAERDEGAGSLVACRAWCLIRTT